MKKPPKLPEAELDVMLALWSFSQPVRTARILEALQARRTWTASTLKVVLGLSLIHISPHRPLG